MAAAQVSPVSTQINKPADKAAEQLPEEKRLPVEVAQPQIAAPPIAIVAEHARDPKLRETAKKLASKYDVNRIGDRGVGGGVNFYSLEKEQMLGRELASEVEHESRLIADAVITEYVNRVGQNIVRNSDARVPFIIKVVDNDEINAYALPGGYFYVNTGLIQAADNEAELAGVMAHEIAHVAARHATKNATKAEIWNLASIPLIFVGGPAGYAVRQAVGLAVPMSFLKFSRDAEREADLLGLEYEYAAGYDPAAFVEFFEKLKLKDNKKHSFMARAFTTHPMTQDRIKSAQEMIARILPPKDEYLVTTSEFDAVKAHLADLTNRRLIDAGNGERPSLRKRGPEQEKGEDKSNDRPTLRRKN